MAKEVLEYLYVDTARLDSYVSQLQGDLIKYDRIPKWSVELSITGPRAGAEDSVHARTLSVEEKLQVLRKYIDKNKEARSHFEERDLNASKVFLPRSKFNYPPEFPELVFWVADYETGSTISYLLEGHLSDDGTPSVVSSFSALRFVAAELGLDMNVLSTDDPEDPDLSPLKYLRSLGAVVASPRLIRSLYRLRQTGGTGPPMHVLAMPFRTASVGYAIYVAAIG